MATAIKPTITKVEKTVPAKVAAKVISALFKPDTADV